MAPTPLGDTPPLLPAGATAEQVAAAALRRELRLRGWPDVELGRRARIRQSKISRLLRAEQSLALDDLVAIVEALGWDLRRLADAMDDLMQRPRPAAPLALPDPSLERLASTRRRYPFLPEVLVRRMAAVEQQADALLVQRDELERVIDLHRRRALERAAGRLDEVAEGEPPEG